MTSYLPTAVTAPLAQGADLVRSAVGSVSWGPALSVSKAAVTSLFSKIEIGTLIVEDQTSGKTTVYGQKMAKEHLKIKMTNGNGTNDANGVHKKAGQVEKVHLVVKKETFWVRLFLFADMGFAETYMLGEVECADLTGFFMVSISHSMARFIKLTIRCSCSSKTAPSSQMPPHSPPPSQRPSLDWPEVPTRSLILYSTFRPIMTSATRCLLLSSPQT